jgi:hypothetical protein
VVVKYEVKTVKKEKRRQRVEGRHGPRKERGKKEERWKKVKGKNLLRRKREKDKERRNNN